MNEKGESKMIKSSQDKLLKSQVFRFWYTLEELMEAKIVITYQEYNICNHWITCKQRSRELHKGWNAKEEKIGKFSD